MSGWQKQFQILLRSRWGLSSKGWRWFVQSRLWPTWRKFHGNSQRQLFDTVAWQDECLSEPTMDRAWPQHLNIEAQAAKVQTILAQADVRLCCHLQFEVLMIAICTHIEKFIFHLSLKWHQLTGQTKPVYSACANMWFNMATYDSPHETLITNWARAVSKLWVLTAQHKKTVLSCIVGT